jgi:hypothetical protein
MPALTDYTSCNPRVCPRGRPPHRAACYKRKGATARVAGCPMQCSPILLWRSEGAPFSLTEGNRVRGEWEGSAPRLAKAGLHAVAR